MRTWPWAASLAQAHDPSAAADHFQQALTPPKNLGEAKHLLANQSDVHYLLGLPLSESGDEETARRHLAARSRF